MAIQAHITNAQKSDWDELRDTTEFAWDAHPHRAYVAELAYFDHRLEFRVYRACRAADGSLEYMDWPHHQEDRSSRGGADVWLSGAVKWDGCCNFTLEDAGVMAHVCDVEEVHDLAGVFDRLYQAAARLPSWDKG